MKTNTIFLHKCLTTLCLFGLIGFALGFTKYFESGYWWLPLVPNIFDSAFIIIAAVYLSYRALFVGKHFTKEEIQQ